ncbi:hypothetical protein Pcinc_041777, partial [Petrolisthes cinctipes]
GSAIRLSKLSTLVNGIQSRSVHGIAPLTSAVDVCMVTQDIGFSQLYRF